MNKVMEEIKTRQFRIATTSVKLRLQSKEANLVEILKLVDRTATGCSPDIIVLSESIYTRMNSNEEQHESIPGPITDALAQKCVQYNCYIVFNMNEMRNSKAYNTNVILNRQGKIVGQYDKYFIAPKEDLSPTYIVAGTEFNVIQTEFGMFGMEICYDLDPVNNNDVTKGLKDNGAEIILSSTIGDYAFSAQKGAKDNNIWMVIAGQDSRFSTITNIDQNASAIIDPKGNFIAGVTDRSCLNTDWPEFQYRDGDGSYAFADIDLGPIIV